MRKYFYYVIILVILLVPALCFAGGGHDHGASEEGAEKEGGEHGEEEEGFKVSDSDLKNFGLNIETAGPVKLMEGVSVSGRIVPVDERLAHVGPRFSGVIKEVRAKVGDIVKPDTVLAVIQNNQNLQSFNLTSAISGVVIRRHATLGETVAESDVVFVVADLSEVWAEFAVYKQDVDKVKVGAKTRVSIASHLQPIDGNLIFFSPVTEERTQSRLARVAIKNPEPHFSPGAFVSGVIATEEVEVPVAVNNQGIQRIKEENSVFVREGEEFKAVPILTGRTDGNFTEVLKGISGGTKYASGKTFLLKAEAGKAEAEHSH